MKIAPVIVNNEKSNYIIIPIDVESNIYLFHTETADANSAFYPFSYFASGIQINNTPFNNSKNNSYEIIYV